MVFGGTYVPLSEIRPVIIGGYVLYNTRGGSGAKKRSYFVGGFVVSNEVCDGMVVGGEKIEHLLVCFCVG